MQQIHGGFMRLKITTRTMYNTPVAFRVKPGRSDADVLLLSIYTKSPLPPGEVNKYRLFIHNRHEMSRRMRNHQNDHLSRQTEMDDPQVTWSSTFVERMSLSMFSHEEQGEREETHTK